MIQELQLDSFEDIDGGRIAEELRVHLRRIWLDYKYRPADATARVVTMKIKLVPELEADGSCDRCKMAVEFSSSIPKHKTRTIELGMKASGMLVFNPDSPDNVVQSTMFDDNDD